MIQTIPKSESSYLAAYMSKVSRSFSLVAPEVEAPMDDYLAVAYLICRVVDNIEDAEQPFDWKRRRFGQFEELLDSPQHAAATLGAWEREEWPGLTDYEQAMMSRGGGLPLWQIYAEMPPAYQAPIRHWAHEMAQGMCRTVDPAPDEYFHDRDGVRLPVGEEDYNRYCWFVAGTVGLMITEMIVHFYGVAEETAVTLLSGSESCGRGLQKTNIVKDFAKDLDRGFSFLPDSWLAAADYAPLRLEGAPAAWKTAVICDVLAELNNAVPYITNLPAHAPGFRKAGLLMLIPAYDTILLAASRLPDLFTPRHEVKISRPKMAQAVSKAQRLAPDDNAIRAYAAGMSSAVTAELERYG